METNTPGSNEHPESTPENQDKSPVKTVFTLVYHMEEQRYGIIGTKGFLDDEIRAYGFIVVAQHLLDDYFKTHRRSTNRIISAAQGFKDKMNMWSFLRKKR